MKNYSQKETDEYGTYYYNEQDDLHRTDGPAIEYGDGDKYWFVNGERLTEDEFNNHPDIIKYMNLQKLKEALGV